MALGHLESEEKKMLATVAYQNVFLKVIEILVYAHKDLSVLGSTCICTSIYTALSKIANIDINIALVR